PVGQYCRPLACGRTTEALEAFTAMKTDTTRIDKAALLRRLRDEYELEIEQLAFVPKGEESYGYIATTASSQRYFVKVHSFVEGYDEAQLERLQRPYQIVDQLVNTYGLHYLVHPLRTSSGEVVTRFDAFTVAVFDYIVGDGLALKTPQPHDWQQVAKLIATLHNDTRKLLASQHSLGLIPEEPFAIGFKSWLLDVLAATEQAPRTDDAIRQQAWQLLNHEKELVLQYLLRAEELADKAQQTPYDPALTHGDLWSGNFLCNTDGEPVLIDPSAAFAHREMDLAMARLFGGFDPAFFAAYERAWPLEPGFVERLGIYQLYYLMVHLNLFGEGYLRQVRDILNRFA
ncbi:MAG TPA: fructosamine kinase family protein, partial [Saprospiraceae bacterium]|nr:fructosamine kinase family protein [Saprospiraceae bacterium]